jgi:signal transduction histidine kinase
MSARALVARLRQAPYRVQDAVLAGSACVLVLVEWVLLGPGRGPWPLEALALAALTLPLAWRRRDPLAVVVVFMAVAVPSQLWLAKITGGVVPIATLLIACYSAGRHLTTRRAVLALAVALAGIVAVSVIEDGTGDVLFPAIFFGWAPWLAGRILRSRTLLARELQERALRLEVDRGDAALRAVVDERRRMARELHDVVTNSMSVMVIQAGAGRRLAAAEPERAAECAALIERLGRETLAELRLLLGVMGSPDERPLEPQPCLARVGELVERARAAGLPVELRIHGDAADLPAGIDVAGYRIVQEALTNVLRHAGPAHARVVIRYEPDCIELEVSDDGRGPPENVDARGVGHGLLGMRERAVVCGGDLSADPGGDGGYVVRARLPVRSATIEAA